jgi:hypothetical protein
MCSAFGNKSSNLDSTAFAVLFPMVVGCSLVGLLAGYLNGFLLDFITNFWVSLILTPFLGILWSILTGGLGGVIGLFGAFLIKGIVDLVVDGKFIFEGTIAFSAILSPFMFFFGSLFALPYGISGFILFTIPHRTVLNNVPKNRQHAFIWATAIAVSLLLSLFTIFIWILFSFGAKK